MVFAMLIASSRIGLHQGRFVRQLQTASVHDEDGTLQSWPTFLQLAAEFLPYVVRYFLDYLFRHIAPRLAETARVGGEMRPSRTLLQSFSKERAREWHNHCTVASSV